MIWRRWDGPGRLDPPLRVDDCLVRATYDEALELGKRVSRNVYGSSTHEVTVECREVSDWRPAVRPGALQVCRLIASRLAGRKALREEGDG